jgi:hypothetical protein
VVGELVGGPVDGEAVGDNLGDFVGETVGLFVGEMVGLFVVGS